MSEFWTSFTREQTDTQYNPTLWTQRLPTDDLLPAHIDFTTESSERYRSKVGGGLQTIENLTRENDEVFEYMLRHIDK